MFLSVVIPTRNRALSLQKVLESICGQSCDPNRFEVIVIDNGSTDNTVSVCTAFRDRIQNFRYIKDEHPGLHIGRNRGYLESRGDIVVYADDDIIAPPSWLKSIGEGFGDNKVVLVGGNNIPQFEETPPSWIDDLWTRNDGIQMLLDFSCIMLGEKEKQISPYYVFGCNFSVRKSILDSTAGFHPDGMPDELLKYRGDGESYIAEYIKTNRLVSMFVPGASVYHCVPKSRMTTDYIGKVNYRSGITYAYTMLRNQRIKELKRHMQTQKRSIPVSKPDMGEITYIKQKRFYEGMLFLLEQYETDDRIKEWILRRDYLGENGYL